MVIIPCNGRNERMGQLFKTHKALLMKDGIPALKRTVMHMENFGLCTVICGTVHESQFRNFNRVVIGPTKNVIETIHVALNEAFENIKANEPLFIVDCDVIPEKINKPNGTTVYLFSNVEHRKNYSNFDLIDGYVCECNEKERPLEYAGAGVYYFETVGTFLKYSNYCSTVAEVIAKMRASGELVKGDTTSEIFRFGTLEDITGLEPAL